MIINIAMDYDFDYKEMQTSLMKIFPYINISDIDEVLNKINKHDIINIENNLIKIDNNYDIFTGDMYLPNDALIEWSKRYIHVEKKKLIFINGNEEYNKIKKIIQKSDFKLIDFNQFSNKYYCAIDDYNIIDIGYNNYKLIQPFNQIITLSEFNMLIRNEKLKNIYSV